jgi:zinc-binding in reverse transcriptase
MHDLLEVFQNFHGPWGPPKCKLFFSWLVLQNRVWMVARLAQRGCQNFGLCELCNQHQVSDSREKNMSWRPPFFQPLVLNPRVVQLANKIGLVFMVLNQRFGMAFNRYER